MKRKNNDQAEIHPNALARWLVLNGYAEDTRGYGHVTGEDLAEALLKKFIIRERTEEGR